jgi:hypothetical protein
VAVSCSVDPGPIVMGLGVIVIDCKAAGVAVSVVLPDTAPDVAVITVEPTANALARPELAFTVATAGVPEVQVTLLVKSAVLVSENVPVAVNCCVTPSGMLGMLGVTAIDTKPLTKDTLARFVLPVTK